MRGEGYLHRPVLLLGPLDLVMHRVGKQLLRRLAKEGDTANEELVEDDAHAPPVHRLAVSLSQDHLENTIVNILEEAK